MNWAVDRLLGATQRLNRVSPSAGDPKICRAPSMNLEEKPAWSKG
jgi:hypothetical protein